MRKLIIVGTLVVLTLIMVGAACALAAKPIKLIVDGENVSVQPPPSMISSRVFVPIRFVAETLGAEVYWDAGNTAVVVNQGNRAGMYLKGRNDPLAADQGIGGNFISSQELKDILDDDNDRDLADFRDGHNGGDLAGNDPLVIDLRAEADYEAGHIPTAVWVDAAENMSDAQNVKALKDLLQEHVDKGGKSEIVLYCYTGNSSGLVCGVLGAMGLNVRNMRFGYDIAWAGTKSADRAVRATIEDKDGNTRTCGG
ncbi:MAG: rhodanese-like domain-containing protein [Bacillota bacterium]